LPEAIERARHGPFSPQGLQGFDLAGKVIGVIGAGSIGQHVIRIARGFGMDVLASDPREDKQLAEDLGFRYAGLDELLASSDVITLHVPATQETRHMLSQRSFAGMKDGAVLINTARGSLIEPEALIEALRSRKVAAAGLDVLPEEPLIREEAELISSIYAEQHDLRDLLADHVLLRMPNVIVTPHSAFNTREAIERIVQTSAENIQAFLEGHARNVVTPAGQREGQ
jgi:D-lactate dehydrogenase